MQTGYRFRCYPSDEAQQTLLRWIGCQRFIKNAKVTEDRYFRAFQRKALSLTGVQPPIDQQYAHFIGPDSAWLRDVPSVVLRNGAVRWMQTYSRFFKKLGGRPTLQKRHGPQSVWLTSELFTFEERSNPATGEIHHDLHVGTKKFPVGSISYVACRSHTIPNSITITIYAGQWYVSFCNEDEAVLETPQEIAARLAKLSVAELTAAAVGIDRGVAIPAMRSDGEAFLLDPICQRRLRKKQRTKARYQRRLARRQRGSVNRRKCVRRIALIEQYGRNVRRDFAHQASHRIATNAQTQLIVFEDLGVQRMTRRPKARRNERGHWANNGATAKSGLNKSILASGWGKLKEYTSYKAARAGKLVLVVPAHHTSQACSRCGHTHPDNRKTQADFVCQDCGFATSADLNAAKNIRDRGVQLILSGQFQEKAKKKTMGMRKKGTKVGTDRPEPGAIPTSVETQVSHSARKGRAHKSSKQKLLFARVAETPTSTVG